jgi:ATP-dependent Lon protease
LVEAGDSGGTTDSTLGPDDVERLLGPPTQTREAALDSDEVGTATAMVWTEYGGEILFVETAAMRGTGQLTMTGSLGEVLQESARTALSHIRSRAQDLGVDPDFMACTDIHVHIPAGAVPKDGPSAGVTIAAALVSRLTDRPARRGVALSGELTLSGRLLPVGGVREKILAAGQAGVTAVVLPEKNRAEVEAMEAEVRDAVTIHYAADLAQALEYILL